MSWTRPLSYLSILSLLEIVGKQVAQATPSPAPAKAKSSDPVEKKPSPAPEKSAAQAKSSYEEAYEKEKKRCRSVAMGSKLILYTNCLDEARRRLKNPPKPEPERTPLEKELALCNMAGKPVQVWQCKREAPEKIARQQKEAAKEAERLSKLTPEQRKAERLQRALNSCSVLSKGPQIMQCRTEAKEKYGSK